MARDFDGSTQFLSGAASLVTTFPFTLAVRYNTDTTAVNQNLFGLYAGATAQAHYMSLSDSGGTKRGFATSVSTAGGFDHAITTTTVTVSTWSSMVGLYASSTSRRSVLNGDIAGAGTNTATNAPVGLDTFHAAQYNPTDVDEFNGRLAEIAVWSSIITDAEITAYDRGVSPLLISPGTLQHYWQLLGRNDPEPDLIGRASFTLNGTPANAVHPRVYMPRRKTFWHVGAVGGTTFMQSITASSISTARLVRRGSLSRSASSISTARVVRQGQLRRSAIDISTARVQRQASLFITPGVTFRQGINFRATAGLVTDGTDDYREISTTANYPATTSQGNTVGWETLAPSGTRDRSTGVDSRLAGLHFIQNSIAARTYRFDLPFAGSYRIRLASGDATIAAQSSKIELFDGSTSLGVLVDGTSPTGQFFDANGTLHTSAANWVSSNTLFTATFASTIARFTIGASGGANPNSVICHIYIESSGVSLSSTSRASLQRQGRLVIRGVTTAKATVLRSLVKFITIAATSISRAAIQRLGQLRRTAVTTSTASILRGSVRGIFVSVASVSAATAQSLANIFRVPFSGNAGLFVSRKARRQWKRRPKP